MVSLANRFIFYKSDSWPTPHSFTATLILIVKEPFLIGYSIKILLDIILISPSLVIKNFKCIHITSPVFITLPKYPTVSNQEPIRFRFLNDKTTPRTVFANMT